MTTTIFEPLETPLPHRFTREEYERMSDDGYFEGRHVQLIDGEIIDMPGQKHEHYLAIELISNCLRGLFGDEYWVRAQGPLPVNADSMPEPDVAVTKGSMRSATAHPTTALLAVEVSDSSLRLDRERKSRLYAAAGIPEYWILNLIARQLEVYRNPVAEKYTSIVILKAEEKVSPLAAPDAGILVSGLLP